jgi:hypothetical protein
MAISKEQLLKGRKATTDVYLNETDFVTIRTLTTGEIETLNKKYKNDEMALTINMIATSLIDPVLSSDEVRDLEQSDFTAIAKKITELMGVDIEDVKKEVETFRKQ